MFNVGDKIIISSDDCPFGITTNGSIGTIIGKNPFSYIVHFEYIASNRYGHRDYGLEENCYNIGSRYMKHFVKRTKEELVCMKIKAMSNRFEKRKSHV